MQPIFRFLPLQSCRHDSWVKTAKYLIDDVPMLLKSDTLNSVPGILSLILKSLPANAGDFIKWVAEVRRGEENGSGLSQEEKGRLAVKVFIYLFETSFISSFLSKNSCLQFHESDLLNFRK